MKIIFLTIIEINMIHDDQIKRYGGLYGLRDENLLDSALNYPQATFENKYLHTDIYHMAAAYMIGIIKNHPFLDGNKRTGLITTLLFLARNNIHLDINNEELFNLTIEVAISKITEQEIALFFKKKTITYN